jgi:hypothetical protein
MVISRRKMKKTRATCGCPRPSFLNCAASISSSSDLLIIIMVRVGEDQEILTLEHQKDTLGVLP